MKALSRARHAAAERSADEIVQRAKSDAEAVRKEAELAAREESFKLRERVEKDLEEAREELGRQGKRLSRKEDNLDRKLDMLTKKERYLETTEQELADKHKAADEQRAKLQLTLDEEMKKLHTLSGLSREEARTMLLKKLERDMEHECAEMISKYVERAKEECDTKGRRILSSAIQKCAAEHTCETTVSSIDLPGDDMKGRIIGREGRNIRAFEKATGVDVIVDDTPGVVVISGFDGVRREIARRAMDRLVSDGRIHPARIEEVVQSSRTEVEKVMQQAGRQAAMDLGVKGLHPKEVALLGRLKFRTSYGQNVLQHSIEVAELSGLIAGELRLDVALAKRAGLLHDIGKAVEDSTGGHPEVGGDVVRRFDEPPEVVNAVEGHHEDVEATSVYTPIVTAADAVSASRPGARRETLEKYIQRLEKLEGIATSFGGVRNAYAIQAGRELRVMVDSERVDDPTAARICRDIAKEVEDQLTYPGEVKVTLIREKRTVEYAR
jgi:ribonuclease Y